MVRKSLGVALVGGLAMLPMLAAPAGAATRDLDAAKRRCTVAVDVRIAALDRLDVRLRAAKRLTPAHRDALVADNAAARTGLRGLRTKIDGDTDAATLKTDCESVVRDYRVFALRVPQAHLVIAADAETAAITKLQAIDPKLSAAIDKAGAGGTDVSAAKQALSDYEAKVADAGKQVSGVADTLLGYQPADYNANPQLLKPSRTALHTAAADLRAARNDVRTIVTTLKAAK